MHSIYVYDIVNLCNGKVLYGDKDLELSTFCTDTRNIKQGNVYVGICGERLDGNDFYEEAIKKGASCLILNKEPVEKFDDITIVLVEDTLKCLQELASYKRSLYDIPVIAVTGSVGKTSTKDIIYSVVSKKYNTHRTIGNYNNHLGVPLTILGLQDDAQALVIEMGMNHFGEISLLSKIAKPTIAVITNIGTAHIGNLGSREGILKAKLEILEGMVGNQVVFNMDDDMLSSVVNDLEDKYEISTVSIFEKSTYQAVNVEEDVFESCFDILGKEGTIQVQVGGKSYIYNALVAYAIGNLLDISIDDIQKGILEFKLSSSRLEKKVTSKGTVIIDDTYNANYDSMKSSIELLGRVKDKRKIVILGDMLELGEYSREFHRNIGDVVMSNSIDILITVGEYSKEIEKRVLELGMGSNCIYHFDKESDSYSFLEKFIDKNDIVLLKGSHGIHLIGIVDKLMEI